MQPARDHWITATHLVRRLPRRVKQAVWTGERFVIFRTVHRDENAGEAGTVAFGAPR